jgi:hypothetical protein
MVRYRRLFKAAAAILTMALIIPALACAGGNAETARETPGMATDSEQTDATAAPSETPHGEQPDGDVQTTPGNADAANETEASESETDAGTAERDASNGTGAYTITADISEEGKTYVSSAADENALRVENGCVAAVEGGTIEKTAGDTSSSGDSAQLGLNAAVLTYGGAKLTLTNSLLTSDALGANGIFAYGGQSDVTAESTTVRVLQDNACGLVAAGGGLVEANNLSVLTKGAAGAAICTLESGGTVIVDSGTYTANGEDAAAIVSGSYVAATNATLRAAAGSAVEIRGGGKVTLAECSVSGSTSASRGGTGKDAPGVAFFRGEENGSAGDGTFTMTNGSLKSGGAELFSVIGTNCSLSLNNVSLTLGNGVLLRVTGDADNEYGGNCTVVCSGQILTGKIFAGEGTTLSLQINDGSSFTGAINPDGEAGEVSVVLGDDCTWSLTSDAYVSSFTGRTRNIETNGFTLYVNGSAATK